MSDLAIAGVSLIAGIVATIVVSRYYFQRTVSKAITPYLLSHTDVLGEIDTAVRDALKVQYRGVNVADLTDTQLLVANTGERAIREQIEPLTLNLPQDTEVLDAKVLHVEPAGRVVDVAVVSEGRDRGPCVRFLIPLLNSGDFFIVRLLMKGAVPARDLRFTIVAEDLPPQLNLEWLFSWKTAGQEKRRFEPVLLAFGMGVLAISAAVLYIAMIAWSNVVGGDATIVSAMLARPLLAAASLAAGAFIVVFGVLGIGMIIGAFGGSVEFPRPKRHFVLPEGIFPQRRGPHRRHFYPD